jgi:hypothetical protein
MEWRGQNYLFFFWAKTRHASDHARRATGGRSQTHAQERLQMRTETIRTRCRSRRRQSSERERQARLAELHSGLGPGETISWSLRPIDFVLCIHGQLFAVSRFPVAQVRFPAHGIRQPREVRVRNGIRLYHHRWHTRRRKPNPRVSFCAARRSPIAATGRTINRSNPVHSGSSRMILRAVLGHQNCPSTSKVTKVLVSKASAPFTISP